MTQDRLRLRKQWRQINRNPSQDTADTAGEQSETVVQWQEQVAQAQARLTYRQQQPWLQGTGLTTLDLPITSHREEILRAIEEHPVIIIAGETGSGKTTQLPKLCLEAGRGTLGNIGHTQPRRLAARSLAQRIQAEIADAIEAADTDQSDHAAPVAGYKVRFDDKTRADTQIKVMTDGILLAEIQQDRDLLQYDTLIIDEAHERSLNIDFLLGYLKQLLKRRHDLKVIITSATIDTASFARFFDAPVIEVSGRTYPVEIRYQPAPQDQDSDDVDHPVLQAMTELMQAHRPLKGDVLVFLSGEQAIRQTQRQLKSLDLEILPLYGRLSAQQQDQVFKSSGRRRIILATNIAETSITVPGIVYVIDTGYARLSRYSYRNKIQQLPIERISQAAANQRAGRCGRVAPGICLRLYSQTDFLNQPEFTEPEILRTNLASTILQMKVLGLGDIERFPFIDRPDSRLINDGRNLLTELRALEGDRLTRAGRQLARLPLDVRFSAVLYHARHYQHWPVLLVIVTGLSIQDPRERPAEARSAADQAHKAFRVSSSDFLTLYNLWHVYHQARQAISRNQLKRFCERHFLSPRRMHEWTELYAQLEKTVQQTFKPVKPAMLASRVDIAAVEAAAVEAAAVDAAANGLEYPLADTDAIADEVHRLILTGFNTQVALHQERREYIGPRDNQLQLFPGSVISRRKRLPKWIVAAELIETQQKYAHMLAVVQPEWIEQASRHLLKQTVFDPHWSNTRGYACAYEQLSLYGLILVSKRVIDYTTIDPVQSRALMLHDGLAYQTLMLYKPGKSKPLPFIKHNQKLVRKIHEIEAKTRRRDLLVDTQTLAAKYDALLPDHLLSLKAVQTWYHQADKTTRNPLFFGVDDFLQTSLQDNSNQFPTQWQAGNIKLPISYRFAPDADDDGASIDIPLAYLNQLDAADFDWLVPGLLVEKVTALIRTLPKTLRRQFVPIPDFAQACVEALTYRQGHFYEQVAYHLQRMTGAPLADDYRDISWQPDRLARHLAFNFKIRHPVDQQVIQQGRNLRKLQQSLSDYSQSAFSELPTERYEKQGVTAWYTPDCPPEVIAIPDPLPDSVTLKDQGLEVTTYPALTRIDATETATASHLKTAAQDRIDLLLYDQAAMAAAVHYDGVLALYQWQQRKNVNYLRRQLPYLNQMALYFLNIADTKTLQEDLTYAVVRQAFYSPAQAASLLSDVLDQPAPRNRVAFDEHTQQANQRLMSVANPLGEQVLNILTGYHRLQGQLQDPVPQWLALKEDVQQQIDWLIYAGFVSDMPIEQLKQVPRYLQAIEIRLQKTLENPKRDQQLDALVTPYWDWYLQQYDAERPDPALQRIRWLIEEYRVSVFAQHLGTAQKVSDKKMQQLIDQYKPVS